MRLFDKMKYVATSTVAVLALSAMVTTGINVQAAEIEAKTKTYNHGVYEIGTEISVYGTNLKINGKKYTKGSIKKKVKTIQTGKNVSYVDNQAAHTEYFDYDDVPDTVDYNQQFDNYKRIYMHNYELTFLKAGKYTISYDQYTNDEPKKVKNADGKSYTVTPVLKKTTVKAKYKVLKTSDVFKSIQLGKTKHTFSTKKENSGAKTTTKHTINNRFLKGTSGKLIFKVSDKKTYAFNNALVVTRDANGVLAFNVVGNKSKIAYSTGVYSNSKTYEKINQDANGDVKDPITGKYVKTAFTTSQSTGKYKETTVYYGYKNKFTGDSLSYSVTPTTVYVHRRESSATNAGFAYATDVNGNIDYSKPILDPVAATIITRTYPQQVLKHEAGITSYKTITVVDQRVVLSTDKTMNESSDYYIDAEGKHEIDRSSGWDIVLRDNISLKVTDAEGNIETNDAYIMAFHIPTYEGTWIADNDLKIANNDYYTTCYTEDAQGNTTRWVYQYKRDAEGNRIEIENDNIISNLGVQFEDSDYDDDNLPDNMITFKAK